MENKNSSRKAVIVAFLNAKGGVGKTTTAASVGAALALKGREVLLVDLDPQCSLTVSFGVNQASFTIWDVMINTKKDVKFLQLREHLSLLASDIMMYSIDAAISNYIERERKLQRFLSRYVDKYDYILLDCPPNFGQVSLNALIACDSLLVPVTAETLSIKGLQALEEMLNMISEVKPVGIDGLILTRYNSTKGINRDLAAALRIQYGPKVFGTVIRDNSELSKAQAFRKTIFEFNPESHGAEDYLALTEEFLSKYEVL